MATDKFNHIRQAAYSAIRAELQTGDIFLASGNYAVSRIIEHVTRSMFSHVGFIFRWKDRVLVLESVEDDGVRAAPLSQYVNDYECGGTPYDGRLFIGRCNTPLDRQRIDQMLSEAADLLNRKYNKEEIAQIIARVTIGIGQPRNNNTYLCSEFVDVCFRKIGIVFARADAFIFPEDIAADPKVVPIAEVVSS